MNAPSLPTPACKRLMMAHAFQAGARRVVYRVDALNKRSRAAVLKLGAVEEALLRQDRLTWTSRIRDTVIFSILADEWPGVRDRLDARLAAYLPREAAGGGPPAGERAVEGAGLRRGGNDG